MTIFFGSVPLSSVVALKKRGLFDFHGLFIKCRRELCSRTENEIAPGTLFTFHLIPLRVISAKAETACFSNGIACLLPAWAHKFKLNVGDILYCAMIME